VRCPNCNAECSDQAFKCDFCSYAFARSVEQAPPASANSPSPPPPPLASSQPWVSANASPGTSAIAQNPIPNHMVWAIIATVIATIVSALSCCCIPLGLPSGIAAIVFASKVDKFVEGGDLRAAEEASKNAKLWSTVTTGIGMVFGLWFVVSLVLNIALSMPEFMKGLGH
jgi:uncharacterized membrane protein